MADLLVRGLDPSALKTLKRGAERHHTCLQREVKVILERIAQTSTDGPVEVARRIRENLATKGIAFPDSAELIREDRVDRRWPLSPEDSMRRDVTAHCNTPQ